jgi:hypothetical protein
MNVDQFRRTLADTTCDRRWCGSKTGQVQKPVLHVESTYIDRLRLTAIPTPAIAIMTMAGHATFIDALSRPDKYFTNITPQLYCPQ